MVKGPSSKAADGISYVGVSINAATPNGWFIMEHPIKNG